MLGVVALESTGIRVDPVSRTLKRMAAKPLKMNTKELLLRSGASLVRLAVGVTHHVPGNRLRGLRRSFKCHDRFQKQPIAYLPCSKI